MKACVLAEGYPKTILVFSGNSQSMRNQATPALNSMRKTIGLMAMMITLVASAAAQQRQALVRPRSATTSAPTAVRTSTPRTTLGSERYRIGPGDVLEVRLYKLPELSRDALRVEESGTIRMPLVD